MPLDVVHTTYAYRERIEAHATINCFNSDEPSVINRQVCDQAGVPLEVVHMTDAYWERVVAHSIAEIKAGRTPNPDILCNSRWGSWNDTGHVASGCAVRAQLPRGQAGAVSGTLLEARPFMKQVRTAQALLSFEPSSWLQGQHWRGLGAQEDCTRRLLRLHCGRATPLPETANCLNLP